MSVDAVFGTGPCRWTVPLRPGLGERLRFWLAKVPLDTRSGLISPFRWRRALIRRRDQTDAEYFLLAKPTRPWSERYYLRIDDDTVSVAQMMPRWMRTYMIVLESLAAAITLDGMIDDPAATGSIGLLVLLGFPVVIRLVVVPTARRYDRSYLKVLFTMWAAAPSAEL